MQTVLEEIFQEIQQYKNQGKRVDYIPELAQISPDKYGISYQSIQGEKVTLYDGFEKFSIQSISKIFSLTLAYKHLGGKLWERVGIEPSGNAFNSLIQLELDKGIPRNPFINAGAIVICDVLLDLYSDPKKEVLNFIHKLCDSDTITIDESVYQSELKTCFTNKAMANFMKSFGNLKHEVEVVIDIYCFICSIEMNCEELAKSFLIFANEGKLTSTQEPILNLSETKRLNSIMQSCGFYDESGEFTFKVGLPGKSGVGGGIVALYPKHFAIAVWSPKLNDHGNSVLGFHTLELFTTKTKMSVF